MLNSRRTPIALSIIAAMAAVPVVSFAEPAPMPLLRTTSDWGLTINAATPLTITPETGGWDLSQYDSVYLRVRNPGKKAVTVWARAENSGAKGLQDNCRAALVLEPGKTDTLRLRLVRRPQDPTYAPFKPFMMYFKNINVRDSTVDPAAISQVVVWLDKLDDGQEISVESAVAQGEGTKGPVPFLPFVDKYGQYVHADWPDKIYSDADFAARLKKEEAEMRAYPGAANWNKWGGWKDGPKQQATGFFRTAKVDGKWWLVDPDGALFWSYGPTGVGFGEGSPVTDRESWFAELPPSTGETARYWRDGKGAKYMYYEKGQPYRTIDFSGLNAERKYGKDWEAATVDFMHRRMRNWGFNTVANWSNPKVMLHRKTPYTVAIHYGGPWLDRMPDVFDPGFEKALRERMEKERGTTANDPWNLGYFVDNELWWGWARRASIATQAVVKAPATSATKQVFVADLKTKYVDIAALNTAWGTKYASWDEFQTSQTLPDTKNEKVSADFGDFGLKLADKYFSVAKAAVKSVAPNNLYLGCRFHGSIDGELIQVAAKYCDVISYNIYDKEPGGRLNQYKGKVDAPFLVGEFGVTSDQGQTPFRGETLTTDPEERLRNLEFYVSRAMKYPGLVGVHFFQFRDQPLSGRTDGEATLRGFVNTADTPHFSLVQLNRDLGYKLYERRSGE